METVREIIINEKIIKKMKNISSIETEEQKDWLFLHDNATIDELNIRFERIMGCIDNNSLYKFCKNTLKYLRKDPSFIEEVNNINYYLNVCIGDDKHTRDNRDDIMFNLMKKYDDKKRLISLLLCSKFCWTFIDILDEVDYELNNLVD